MMIEGMELRDWFAGMAIQYAFSTLEKAVDISYPEMTAEQIERFSAKMAYGIANAMMVAREKKS